MHMADNILLFTDFVTLYVVFLALFRDEGENGPNIFDHCT